MTDKYYYIIELKLDGTAEEVLKQINRKNYAMPFHIDGKEIIKLERTSLVHHEPLKIGR